ncbi:MAG: MarR family transcriptional regulator [Nitrososphaerota archaeon]|nr:MarR family transcriptional regulator [Nitrososphaerota archaeon]
MGILIAVTAVAAYQYYKHIRRAQHEYEKANNEYEKANNEYEKASQEYEKAKDFLEDIVMSFDRELKRESAKFDTMVSKVEGSYTTADVSYRKAETIERKIEPIETQLDVLVQSYQAMSQEITENQTENIQYNSNVLSGLSGLEVKLKNIDATQETLKTKITDLEEQIKKIVNTPPPQSQVIAEVMLPPIPIKRDKALATLTDTEIQVLEMLSKEGSKTAPEIKERVHLSREHTARLMKKLYEEGYLEREAGKLPFRYSIKKEMEALLQKVENSAV